MKKLFDNPPTTSTPNMAPQSMTQLENGVDLTPTALKPGEFDAAVGRVEEANDRFGIPDSVGRLTPPPLPELPATTRRVERAVSPKLSRGRKLVAGLALTAALSPAAYVGVTWAIDKNFTVETSAQDAKDAEARATMKQIAIGEQMKSGTMDKPETE